MSVQFQVHDTSMVHSVRDLDDLIVYLPRGLYFDFSGTSAACPHVAGIAALILEDNSGISQKEVANRISYTAQKISDTTYTYQDTTGRPYGTWNEKMGYGLPDAAAAIDCSTENYSNVEVTADDTFDGCKVNISDVTVKNNSKLTVIAASDLVINGAFEIKSGSELEIK